MSKLRMRGDNISIQHKQAAIILLKIIKSIIITASFKTITLFTAKHVTEEIRFQ